MLSAERPGAAALVVSRENVMKFWIITLAVSVAWVALDLSICYLISGFHKAAFDAALGQVAGVGFVAIWAIAILWRFVLKQRSKRPEVAKQYEAPRR